MISLSGAVYVVIYICVAGLIFALLNYLIDQVNPAEPFKRFAKLALLVIAVLIIIGILLSLLNGGANPIFRS